MEPLNTLWAPVYQSLLTDLLQQAVMDLVKKLPYRDQLEVDGIVSISGRDPSQQLVLKIHKLIPPEGEIRSNTSTPSTTPSSTTTSQVLPHTVTTSQTLDSHHSTVLSGLKQKIASANIRPYTQQNSVGITLDLSMKKSDGALNLKKSPKKKSPKSMGRSMVLSHKGRQQFVVIGGELQPKKSSGTGVVTAADHSVQDGHGILKEILSKPPPLWNQSEHVPLGIKQEVESAGEASCDEKSKADEEVDSYVGNPKKIARYERSLNGSLGFNSGDDELSGSQQIQCKICQAKFKSITALQSHTAESHKRYTCKICFNSFSLRCNLRRHERLHAGVKPYSCEVCRKTFSRGTDLKMHLAKHGLQKVPNWITCSKCTKMFANAVNLRIHMYKVHREKESVYACSICEQVFQDIDKFQEHRETHTASLVHHGQNLANIDSNSEGTNDSVMSDDRPDSTGLDQQETGTIIAQILSGNGSECDQIENNAMNGDVDDDDDDDNNSFEGIEEDDGSKMEKKGKQNANLSQIIGNIVTNTLLDKTAATRSLLKPGILQHPQLQPLSQLQKERISLQPINVHDNVPNNAISNVSSSQRDSRGNDVTKPMPPLKLGVIKKEISTSPVCGRSSRKRKSTPVRHIQVESENFTPVDEEIEEEEGCLYIDEAAGTVTIGNDADGQPSPAAGTEADEHQATSDLNVMRTEYNNQNELTTTLTGFYKIVSGIGGDLIDNLKNNSPSYASDLSTAESFGDWSADGRDTDTGSMLMSPQSQSTPTLTKKQKKAKSKSKNINIINRSINNTSASDLDMSLLKGDANDNKVYECQSWGCTTTCTGFVAFEDHCLVVHGRFPCRFCSQTFSGKNNRTRHMKFHITGKRYQCLDCGKMFARPDSLKEHRFIHTKSYRNSWCMACGTSFDKKATLLAHMKKCFTNEQLDQDKVTDADMDGKGEIKLEGKSGSAPSEVSTDLPGSCMDKSLSNPLAVLGSYEIRDGMIQGEPLIISTSSATDLPRTCLQKSLSSPIGVTQVLGSYEIRDGVTPLKTVVEVRSAPSSATKPVAILPKPIIIRPAESTPESLQSPSPEPMDTAEGDEVMRLEEHIPDSSVAAITPTVQSVVANS